MPIRETIWVLETALDDLSPQVAGFVLERALELGALDAYCTPGWMKKNRPGYLLTILARAAERDALVELVLRETSALGLRVNPSERVVLERAWREVKTPYGPIRIKEAGGKQAPEYEDCRAAAKQHGVTLREVMEAAQTASRE